MKIIGSILAIIYIIMLFDTNSLIKTVKDNMNLKVNKIESSNNLVWLYNSGRESYKHEKALKTETFVFRLFIIHNFKNGHMWVIYSNKVKNGDDKILYGSSLVLSHWKIHKENGEWQISAIYEEP